MLSFHALRLGLLATLFGWVNIIKNSGSFLEYAAYLARPISFGVAFRNNCTSLWIREQQDEYGFEISCYQKQQINCKPVSAF